MLNLGTNSKNASFVGKALDTTGFTHRDVCLNDLCPLAADQTPTPTRFIRNCEEVGLFQDLQVNPFEETFRRAVEEGNTGTLTVPEARRENRPSLPMKWLPIITSRQSLAIDRQMCDVDESLLAGRNHGWHVAHSAYLSLHYGCADYEQPDPQRGQRRGMFADRVSRREERGRDDQRHRVRGVRHHEAEREWNVGTDERRRAREERRSLAEPHRRERERAHCTQTAADDTHSESVRIFCRCCKTVTLSRLTPYFVLHPAHCFCTGTERNKRLRKNL